MPKPRIAVLALGGTIASTATRTGAVPQLSADELVAAVPRLDEIAELDCTTFRTVASSDLGFDDVIALAAEIRGRADDGVAGVVVTHGTDTMEETAFVLDLLVPATLPVVVTGAMRHPALASADGPANLLAAVQVAASGATARAGTVVVLDDAIHAARYVRKTSTTNLAAFMSPLTGPIGRVHEGNVRMYTQPAPHARIEVADAGRRPLVPILTTGIGETDAVLRALTELALDGLILAGTGGGHVPAILAPLIGDIAARLPVVIASRTGSGEVLRNTYGTVGADRDLAKRGVLSAGHLDAVKARVLLAVLLMSAPESAAKRFAEFVAAL